VGTRAVLLPAHARTPRQQFNHFLWPPNLCPSPICFPKSLWFRRFPARAVICTPLDEAKGELAKTGEGVGRKTSKWTLSQTSLSTFVCWTTTHPHAPMNICVCVCAQICLETDVNFCVLNSAILLISHEHEGAHASSPMHVFNCAHHWSVWSRFQIPSLGPAGPGISLGSQVRCRLWWVG
jgi:hypothetical protein